MPHYGNKQVKADHQLKSPKYNVLQKRQLHVMKEPNKKLTTESAIVTQEDKVLKQDFVHQVG